MSKGRSCPADYRLPAETFSAPANLACDVLYVIGGLYGNRQALDAIERRLAAEPNSAAVFNGDAHWFDCDPAVFSALGYPLSLQPFDCRTPSRGGPQEYILSFAGKNPIFFNVLILGRILFSLKNLSKFALKIASLF